MRSSCIAIFFSFSLLLRAAETNVFYVSPDGNDTWSGRAATRNASDGPVKSLHAARDAIRKARAKNMAGPVRVDIRGGIYLLDEPFTLEPQDSGTADSPVLCAA